MGALSICTSLLTVQQMGSKNALTEKVKIFLIYIKILQCLGFAA